MKLAVMLPVCEVDGAIALLAIQSLSKALGQTSYDLFIIDDGSESDVSASIQAFYQQHVRGNCVVTRLPRPLGYHHILHRMWRQFADILGTGIQYSHILRIDPDTLFLSTDLADFLEKHCQATGLYSEIVSMRKRDRVLLLSDLVPGYRRKIEYGRIQHQWAFGRLRPAWHAPYTIRSLIRSDRFRFGGGCFLLISWRIIQDLGNRGVFDIDVDLRRGLIFGDDLLISICAVSLGYSLYDLRAVSTRFGFSSTPSLSAAPLIEKARPYYIHPVKNTTDGIALRTWLTQQPWADACH